MWAIIGSILLASPSEITLEWESKVLGIHHGVATLADVVEEMIVEPSFDKGFLEKLKKVSSTGEYIEYWGNGQIKVRLPYKDGKANGHLHGWYENGNDAFKGFFKEGMKQGIHISFYPKTDGRILTYNEKGQLDGDQSVSLPNGKLATAIEYKEGKAQGSFWCRDEKGEETNAYYEKGKLAKDSRPVGERNKPLPRKDGIYVHEVIDECARELEEEFHVKATRTGAGMPFDVEKIIIQFEVDKKGTVEEARKLLLKFTDRLVEVTNRYEKLRPYLREYPFTAERAHIGLSFQAGGDISRVIVGKHNIIYYDGEKPYEEPYEEAVKK